MQMELRVYRKPTNEEKEKCPIVDLIGIDINSIYDIEDNYKLELYDKTTGNVICIKEFSIGYSEHSLLRTDVIEKLRKIEEKQNKL